MGKTRHHLRWTTLAIVSGAMVIGSSAASAQGATVDPQVAFNNHCRTCHAINPGDNRLGPALHGVMGRKAGSVEGFDYSPGFKTTDLVWNEANMDQFIADPNSVFPGSKMATFAGLSDGGARKAILDYLKELN